MFFLGALCPVLSINERLNMKRKKALMVCHTLLVKKGMFFIASALLQYLNGNKNNISIAALILRRYSFQLQKLNLL